MDESSKKILILAKNLCVNTLGLKVQKKAGQEILFENLYDFWVPRYVELAIKKTPFVSEYIIYGVWKENVKKYSKIIVFDSDVDKKTLRFFKKVGAQNKVILSFLNKLNTREKELHRSANKLGIKQVTYNMHDAKKFDITYVPQFWNRALAEEENTNRPLKWDIIFCGAAKKRLQVIREVEGRANEQGLKTNFWIVSKNKERGTKEISRDYREYMNDVSMSCAILDIVGDENWGLTWRPLEAIFSRKKLITNYKDITKYDFYNNYKENILILNKDNLNHINDFIQKEYVPCDENFDEYDFSTWINKIEMLK